MKSSASELGLIGFLQLGCRKKKQKACQVVLTLYHLDYFFLSFFFFLICKQGLIGEEANRTLNLQLGLERKKNMSSSINTVPFLFSSRVGPMIGLLLIALGTGGIKPCVSAFGGDQFTASQVSNVI